MAYEICTQSLRTGGAAGGGVGVVGVHHAATAATKFSSRKTWNPPTRGDLRSRKLRQKVHQGCPQHARHRSLQPRVLANPFTDGSVRFFGDPLVALTCTHDSLSEKVPSQQSAASGSTALEKWLHRYLAEIVRHLPEAPFLQVVPKYTSLRGELQRVSEELFEKPEGWKSVKESLLESAPDGIILVHRLDEEALSEFHISEGIANEDILRPRTSLQAGGSSTNVWGVLVHGCETRCNVCYILKTTQVASSTGILTHFCLSKARCFGPSLRSQLQSTWLL